MRPRVRWDVVAILLAITVGVVFIAGVVDDGQQSVEIANSTRGGDPTHRTTATTRDRSVTTKTAKRPTQPSTTTTRPTPKAPSDTTKMVKVTTISGDISPKSVVASGTGVVTAQNMMYTHSVTVYRNDTSLITTIPDTVNLAALGHPEHTGSFRGAPVEAAFTPDARHVYVTNYSMYGPGFGPEGTDKCSPSSGFDNSFVYRIDTKTWKIDQAIEVGAVPKYIAVTPDAKRVLVTNWCSYSLSIIDVKTARQTATISLGAYPRGIAVTNDSKTAYVAVMGTTTIAKVDLETRTSTSISAGGRGPRHVVLSPDGHFLYATLNGAGTVIKLDTRTNAVVASVRTGSNPRSLAMSTDGTALYVVNYNDDTVTKLRSSTMAALQTIATNHHPIGITYDASNQRVWVACYVGNIIVFDDSVTNP